MLTQTCANLTSLKQYLLTVVSRFQLRTENFLLSGSPVACDYFSVSAFTVYFTRGALPSLPIHMKQCIPPLNFYKASRSAYFKTQVY